MNNSLKKTTIGDTEADLAPRVFGFAALGVMAAMFALMGFSMTIIIFLVLVGYFVWRAVAKTEMHEIRGIFEFYLAANEVLRDDERRWYGFEIQDVITRGQRILGMMPDPPPLVHFALGALYHRAGNYQQAENHLAYLVENDKSDEKSRLSATSELRSYVRILRKLEREPAEAPQTTAAIRALERSRRHRAAVLLAESRQKSQEALSAAKLKEISDAAAPEHRKPLLERLEEKTSETVTANSPDSQKAAQFAGFKSNNEVAHTTNGEVVRKNESQNNGSSPPAEAPKKSRQPKKDKVQKSITEVLRDIYD